MRSAISKTIKLFFRTTTLHGFKYLYQGCYYDRVAWAACCVASACCAGALCTVVWARFLQVPAVLALRDLRTAPQQSRLPLLALCPEHTFAARQIINYLSLDPKKHRWLPSVLGRLLRMRHSEQGQLVRLANLLNYHNVTLKEALMDSMPDCDRLTRKCRWQNNIVPCDDIFVKTTTRWGACCIMDPKRLADQKVSGAVVNLNEKVVFTLECSFGVASNESQSKYKNCEMITKYSGEEWSEPIPLTGGTEYYGQLQVVAVQDPDGAQGEPMDSGCESSHLYSHAQCMVRCHERRCGCMDPLRLRDADDGEDEGNDLPPCSLLRIACLRDGDADNVTCSCKPSCRKLVSVLSLESAPLNALSYAVGPMFKDLNASTSTLLNIFIRISDSRLFERIPTESWLTLLSTLGGVFNMFLGVGLFSALELIFLVLVRLPLALKRSAELEKPPSTISIEQVYQ